MTGDAELMTGDPRWYDFQPGAIPLSYFFTWLEAGGTHSRDVMPYTLSRSITFPAKIPRLGGIHKGRPAKIEIFAPPPSPSVRGCPKAYTPLPPSNVRLFDILWNENHHIRMYIPLNT